MQALRSATAVFCVAVICAGVAEQLCGGGWPRRCIKAAAGVYILAVLLYVLPAAESGLEALPEQQVRAASYGTLSQNILSEAERQLSEALAEQCLEQTGVRVQLCVTLAQNGQQAEPESVSAVLPAGCTAEQRAGVGSFLYASLGVRPELTAGEGSK